MNEALQRAARLALEGTAAIVCLGRMRWSFLPRPDFDLAVYFARAYCAIDIGDGEVVRVSGTFTEGTMEHALRSMLAKANTIIAGWPLG